MRLKVWLVVGVLLAFWVAGGEDDEAPAAAEDSAERPVASPPQDVRDDATADAPEPADTDEAERPAADRRARPRDRRPAAPEPARQPRRTWYVSRVVDGDTLELGNGAGVRVVGIDTPERGECGYEEAAAALARLVLHRRVRLTVSDEDTDRYGRWLRYVDAGPVDAGLRLIRGGYAVARYDSRDGYGFHRREPVYVKADRNHADLTCWEPAPAPAGGSGCAPGYSPCLPPYPPDLDCGDVDGPISVTGADPHGLDGDGDGTACE